MRIGKPLQLSYEELLALSQVKSTRNQAVVFRVVDVRNGTLRKNGLTVEVGKTTVEAGEVLEYIPSNGGKFVGFTVETNTGQLVGVSVRVLVERLWLPLLTSQ